MLTVEIVPIVSALISLAALIVSASVAYITLLRKSRVKLHVRPRITLLQVRGTPCVVVGFEILNRGASPGAVVDLALLHKHINRDGGGGSSHCFVPLFMIEKFSLGKEYHEDDFEEFQSIFVDSRSCLTRYIVFRPTEDSFVPCSGEVELELYRRFSGQKAWRKAGGQVHLSVNDEDAEVWQAGPKSVMLVTRESLELRKSLVDWLI